MVDLNCYMCNERVPGSLNGLSNHLMMVHGLTLSRGVGRGGFQCGQNGCQRRYQHFYTLRQHIREYHLIEDEQVVDDRENIHHNNDNDDHDNLVGNEQNESENIEENINGVFNNNNNNAENDTNDNNERFDLRKHIVQMIATFQCKGSITGTTLTEMLNECEIMLLSTQNWIRTKIHTFLENKELLEDDEGRTLLRDVEFDNPFNGLRTLNEQIAALQTHCDYIEPTEIPLGYRVDSIVDRTSGTHRPKIILDTCQYVPIIETLKLVLSNRNIRVAIEEENRSPNGFLASFLDGQYAHVHPLFSQHPHAIRIQLYYDDFEVVNPLGSKTGVHKLGGFYFTIQNLPAHINSDLNAIHVLCLCSNVDVKRYGFQKILAPFMKDLAKLESDEGVILNFAGEQYLLRGSIVGFCGDGLAVHDIFNLIGPSGNQFCRLCMYNRHDLHNGIVSLGQQRSEVLYNEHLQLLQNDNFSNELIAATGIRGNSCLHSSRYFHLTNNKIFDPMHDFLCGICPMILKLILHKYVVEERRFDVEYFNAKVFSFSYGFTERKNKPSANFTEAMLRKRDHTLSQKAMQIWCLTRAFPFLLYGVIPDDDEYIELLLNLLQIMNIVFAPKITYTLMPYLRTLIVDFFTKFTRLFPDVHPINKFHHLIHYPDCIMWSGPLIHYWCMRFEAKHGSIKSRAHNVCNFKNPPKTLIRISQCGQSAMWGSQNLQLFKWTMSGAKRVTISNCLSRPFLHDLNYTDIDQAYLCKSVIVNGIDFRLNLYVCLETANIRDDNLPLFGWIKEIIILGDTEVYLLVVTCETTLYDTDLNAYEIENGDDTGPYCCIKVQNLAYYRPFSCWTTSSSSSLYISLRHILL